VAFEVASRKHGLDALTSSQTEGLGNPHSVSHLQPNKPPARNLPLSTRPNRSRRAEPGTKLRDHGLNVPKVNQTEGLRNPHSVTRLQPNKPPARNPPLSDATKSLQARGDRDQAPTQRAILIIRENIPSGVHHTGPTTSRDIRTARADGHGLHFGTRYPTQSTARGPRSSPGSASPGTRWECPRRTNSARTTSRSVTRTSRRTGDSPPTPHHVLGARQTYLSPRTPPSPDAAGPTGVSGDSDTLTKGRHDKDVKGREARRLRPDLYLKETTGRQPPGPPGREPARPTQVLPRTRTTGILQPHRPNDLLPSRAQVARGTNYQVTGAGPKHTMSHNTPAQAQDSLNRNWTARSPTYRILDGTALHNSEFKFGMFAGYPK
jgi:hypothetical protein